jgi:hypothetical protein
MNLLRVAGAESFDTPVRQRGLIISRGFRRLSPGHPADYTYRLGGRFRWAVQRVCV